MAPNVSSYADRPFAPNPAWPPTHGGLLARIDTLLRLGKAEEALALAPASGAPWVRNARGVCLLRLDRPRQAVEVLRDLVYDPGALVPRPDADPLFQANYAVALLLDGNSEGFWEIVGGIHDRTHPAVAKLDDAVRRWKAGMTVWQKVLTALGGGPPFVPDSPPGDL